MINFCACMGQMYGEPHCPCEMERLGLPVNVAARAFGSLQANMQLESLFGPGGAFETGRAPATARMLVSRNKREGGYVGYSHSQRKHHRVGHPNWLLRAPELTLKQWSKAMRAVWGCLE